MTRIASQLFYSPKQVAEKFSVSTKTIYRWIEAGALRAHRFGAQLRVSDGEIAAFIARRAE